MKRKRSIEISKNSGLHASAEHLNTKRVQMTSIIIYQMISLDQNAKGLLFFFVVVISEWKLTRGEIANYFYHFGRKG